MAWIAAMPLPELKVKGSAVIKHEGRQILLVHYGENVFACANRCPHEGYPLSEGACKVACSPAIGTIGSLTLLRAKRLSAATSLNFIR